MIDYQFILEKYKELLPRTIYHDNLINMVSSPNLVFINNLKDNIIKLDHKPIIAEIGIGFGVSTLCAVDELRDIDIEYHIFDFEETVDSIYLILHKLGFNNIIKHGSSTKTMDSYNWNLLELIKHHDLNSYFDYIFIDGAHTFPIDGLTFFLCDMLLKLNGHIEFDDYSWTLYGHIQSNINNYKFSNQDDYHASFVNRILQQFTEDQLKTKQVALVVDFLVKKSQKYCEISKNRLFKKIKL